jgi:DNA replication and repair protein RecF
MSFREITTVAFRNIKSSQLPLSAQDVFLIGENGQGKTNLLEALYILSYGNSFRNVLDSEIVMIGQKKYSLLSETVYEDTLSKTLVEYENGIKKIEINGKAIKDRKNLIEKTPCILFSHDDLVFITGSPERRRWFFDQTISLIDPVYIDFLRNYKKVLKVRNVLLKEKNKQLLDIIDLQLIEFGLILIEKRIEVSALFSQFLTELLNFLPESLKKVKLDYIPSWKYQSNKIEDIKKEINIYRERDMLFGNTQLGPHRDLYKIHVNSFAFSSWASTGQKRIFALFLRVAQAKFIIACTGKKPVLLLDDVLLELDSKNKKLFLSLLPEYEQAFFTFLPEEPIRSYKNHEAIVYLVKNGEFSNQEGI